MAEPSPLYLSDAARQAIVAVGQARDFRDLGVTQRWGFFGEHRVTTLSTGGSGAHDPQLVSEETAKALMELATQLKTVSLHTLSTEDKRMLHRLFSRLASGDPALKGIFDRIQEDPSVAGSDIVSDYRELKQIAKDYCADRVNREVSPFLRRPQASGLRSTAMSWIAGLAQSEDCAEPAAERCARTPSPSGTLTTTGSYRMSIMTEAAAPASSSGPQTKVVALVKPANQGLGAPDSPRLPNPRLCREWGLLPGQEVQGEHLASFLQTLLGLPTNVPSTVALRLAHHIFGPSSQALAAFGDNLQMTISEKECLRLYVGAAGNREAFVEALVQLQYTRVADELVGVLCASGLSDGSGTQRDDVRRCLMEADSPANFMTRLSECAWLEGQELAAIRESVETNATKYFSEGSLVESAKVLAGNVYDMLSTIEPTQQRYFCSVQAWVDGLRDMPYLTNEELRLVPPIVYGRIAILDAMMVGRDRNAGNIAYKQVSQEALQQSIDSEVAGLSGWMLERVGSRMGLYGEIPAPGSAEETSLVTGLTEHLLTAWEATNGPIPPSKMQLEFDVHLLVTMLLRKETQILDVVPIDNGLVYPDPTLIPEEGFAPCLEGVAHNAWFKEPEASAGQLPPRTARYLAGLRYQEDVLPALRGEVKVLAASSQGCPHVTISFNEEQQKLSYLSSRILQVGAGLGKSLHMIAAMKDRLFPRDESPIEILYNDYCAGVPLEAIDEAKLTQAIEAAFAGREQALGEMGPGIRTNLELRQARADLGMKGEGEE